MTDDIVTRLREMWNKDPWSSGILIEAADEIERLRYYLEWWHHHAELLKCGCPSCKVIIGINETFLESVGYKGPGGNPCLI